MSKILNYKFLLLFLILIIAAFLRLYNLTPQVGGLPPGLYPDEAIDGNNALEGFKVFYPENNGREGLFMNIQAIFLKFLMPLSGNNPEPWMLRIVSAIFGILTVLGVYFLAKELFRDKISFSPKPAQASGHGVLSEAKDERAEEQASPPRWGGRSGLRENEILALLSSFLIATSFWHINFSRISFRAIMAPFFIVWALYFLLKGLNSEKYKLNSVIGGIFLGLGFHSYIAFRAMPLLIIIVWIFYWIKNKPPHQTRISAEGAENNQSSLWCGGKDKELRKKIIISAVFFTISALIVFAPLGIYFLKNPADFFGRTAELSITHSATPLKDLGMNILKTAGMFNFFGDFNWRHNYSGSPELFWPVGILFLIGIFIGLKILFKKTSEAKYSLAFVVLFSWLIIAALPVIISNEGIPHALRSILLIPPVFILAGFGGVWLYEKISMKLRNNTKIPKSIIISAFCFLLSLLIFQAYYDYFIKWGQNPNVQGAFNADYVAIGRQLNSLPKDMPKYVVVEASGVNVRGIPMPAQTVMFITDTFLPEKQKEKNIYYVLPSQINEIPSNSYIINLK